MFSRAAKSIVQSLNQRSYHVTKGNFKAAVGGSTGEVGNSTAQFSQQPRLDSSAVQEVMPFKNLKFKNITPNSAEGQTLSAVGARAVKGTAAEGNVHAIDLAQLRGLGPVVGNVNGTPGFYKNLQSVRNSVHTLAKRNFSSLQPTFHNNNNKLVNNASRSYSKCSGKKDGCDAPAKPCSKSKSSTCPEPNQRLISPCKSRPPCTPGPEKCETPCDEPKCPPPCPPPPPPCPAAPPTCFPPPAKCPRPTPKCPAPCPPRPRDPCPKPCKPPKCPPRCPLDPPPPCPPPPPAKCCDAPKPRPKCPEPPKKCRDKPEPCSGPRPAPHCPTPRESCGAPKRSCEVPLPKTLEQSRKTSPPGTTCCPAPTPPPPRSICCPTPPRETSCPSPPKEARCPPPQPMPNCVPPEAMPKPCPEQKAPCPPATPTCVPPEPAPPCCPKEPACPPAEPSPRGCTPAPKAKGLSACLRNMGKNKKKTTRQSFWKKLTRKMSTHSGNRAVLKTGQPRLKRFKLPSRTFGITVLNLAANRASKCKTGKDICAELDPVCKRLCKKKPATRCSSAERPSCDERMRIAKKAREAEDERSQKRPLKCPTCLPPERCQPPVVPPAAEKMEYPATVCAEAPACPSYKDKVDAEPVLVCPALPQLPKPPSAPVVLCPCPPPPKLPPGPCPCLDSAKEVKLLVPIYLPPCARRPKYTCDRKVYSCKLQRECDKRACPRDDESQLS